jgi:phosphatidylinositol alpha 1,6-mannosyltransferase
LGAQHCGCKRAGGGRSIRSQDAKTEIRVQGFASGSRAPFGYFLRDFVRGGFVKKDIRVAFFPCVYHEVDGVASTSRQFEAFARRRELPFLIVHAGPRNEIATTGPVTHAQLRRSPLKFPIDRAHEYDLVFWKHLRKLESLVRSFQPDVVQITGPSDVGMLGALIAHRLGIPLAASWQTNLHQFARSRAAAVMPFLPRVATAKMLDAVERLAFRATARFYKIPRLLFAPNQEIIRILERSTGKRCLLMSHAVDTTVFSPEFRNRQGGPFEIGYVGRLTAEKNVRCLARLEQALLGMGHRDFRIVVVGEGRQENWLKNHLRHAEFTGVLTGEALSRAFADMDILVFPSETDTFGLVVLEALASGVPAVVTASGGPKYIVRHGCSGFVANNFEEFIAFTATLMSQPELLKAMRAAARRQALATSWDRIFEGMYEAYEHYLLPTPTVSHSAFDVATS